MKKKLSTTEFIRKRAKGSPEEGEEKDSALPESIRNQRKEQEDARRLLDMLVMSGALPDPSLGPLSLDLVPKGKKLEESEGRVGLDLNGVMPFVDVSKQGDVSEYGVKYAGGDPSRAYELMLSQRVPMKVPGGEVEMPIVGQGSYSMPFAGGNLSAQGYVVPRQGDMPKSQYGANLMYTRRFREGGEVTDFIRKREKGSPPEGEVPTDDYIQQMFTGTPPSERAPQRGLLPPELRQAIDVPLDLANTFIRSAAGAVAGPVYGLYKGVTSDKFGTPEGVQEASSEAGKMMQKITGTPKTQTGRDVMEFIGGVAEEAKIPPMPQFLTTPAPGPGSASALLRNYELAETPPVGAINVPGAKAQVTPPKNEMGFFSPTEQVVMNLPQEKGTAQQMLAQISKAPGAKAAELRATGLEEFLKSKGTAPVTRQEIQDYLASNRVQVDEVVLGRGQTLSPEAKRLADDANARMAEIYDEKMLPFFEQIVARGETLGGQEPYSVFSKLRGPLGRKAAKGDQEALAEIDALNLPPEIKDLVLEYGRNKNEYIKFTGQARRMEKPKFDKYNIPGGTNAREIYLTLPNEQKPSSLPPSINAQGEVIRAMGAPVAKFTVPDIHSVSPEADRNRLAHIFLDDRTDAEGNKVLFVQELQSDWAQQGREKGFANPKEKKYKVQLAVGYRQPGQVFNTKEEAQAFAEQAMKNSPYARARVVETQSPGTPSAPFVQNTEDWVNLALKRVIKDAVDNGYDKVAFIKGEQAAKKYRLSTVIDGIEVSPSNVSHGSRRINLQKKDGGDIELLVGEDGITKSATHGGYRDKSLSEIVGKEIAEKIMAAKPSQGDSVSFSVKDMEIGGQGMKGFYDNILPKTANKLLSKLGSKIEEVGIEDQPYLGFKITPEMADRVKTQGLPQFAAGGEVTKFIKAHA